MNIEEKDRLTRQGDMGLAACAIRLRAARLFTGLQQQEVAEASGAKKTTYNNMEVGRSFPSRAVMQYFYRTHRIDFNFLLHGDWSQLPGDVQSRIFVQIGAAEREWDQTED